MALEFDPNAHRKSPKPKLWATYIPSRSPKFKTYTNRGHAVNAIGYIFDGWGYGGRGGGIMYEMQGDEWVEVDRFEPKTACDHCGRELAFHDWGKPGYPRVLYRANVKPKWKNPVVCTACYDRHFDPYNKNLTHRIPEENAGKVDLPEGTMT